MVLAQVPDADHRHPQARHVVPQSQVVVQVVRSSRRQVGSVRPAPASTADDVARPAGLDDSPAAARGQSPGQFHVQRVPGAVRDHVPGEVEPAQGQVADQVEHLVPGRLVGEPQAVVDRPAAAEHEQVGGRQVLADALRSQASASPR